WYETVVDSIVGSDDAPLLAKSVVADLASRGVIRSVPTDCALGAPGYPPGDRVSDYLIVRDRTLMTLRTNGVAVSAERAVHVPVGLEAVVCPGCGARDRDFDRLGWQDKISQWYEGGLGLLSCRTCSREASIAVWPHEPTCGFGNLAFTFWNWP